MNNSIVSNIKPLGFTWVTNDPFLFCVHHNDQYPKGNDQLGPNASLNGRSIGQDFAQENDWRMYHGQTVPGFPAHPHRGFETVTVVLEGFVDHSDSNGSTGRYGNGDVQWMTAGSGLQHAEMFPLVYKDKPNPLELFQIWLNLPKAKKQVTPYYNMLWSEDIPKEKITDDQGKSSEITVIAGVFNDTQAPDPGPDSWATDHENYVGIWLIKMEANAKLNLPKGAEGIKRSVYFYKGSEITIAETTLKKYHSADLDAMQDIEIINGDDEAFLLILQGKPINEPVVQHGPFVMNDEAGIRQAFMDYQKTQFGGWPWPNGEVVQPREKGRFAIYADGREEVK
ncbi:pirin family protein [Carboxylicivirga linearis]|uniref:Pirin family protein n=1 Tax=Carboxylicivirga linearis TaxID=1628157 RepID=A0ABS5JS95_9BACT|nr:pirin family protein [Carboxylicivirga linearis]MBS2097750.1 pirin family protein [Carboxylicivirga linearis]